ncbi:hypothetical protein lerEdw1_000071 [Lerista edwardsae]|nr:hypothetical protein lerEdw1_000071 [Lerista edwardsae]
MLKRCDFAPFLASDPAFERSLEILDEASLAVKPTLPPEERKTEEPDDDDIFGPRYAEINVKGVQVAIPEEDQLPQESHIEVERTERQTEPDKNLMVACLIILLILIIMLGTCAVLFCYLRRFK